MAGGYVDPFRMIWGWLSSSASGAVGGPYRAEAGEIRVDGAAAGQLRLDGQTAGEMRVDGAIIGELDGRHG